MAALIPEFAYENSGLNEPELNLKGSSRKHRRGLLVCARLAGTLVAVLLMVWLGTRYRAAATDARIFFVAPTGDDANDCLTFATPCRTIGATIAKALSGDTIIITTGIYTENVTLDKNLTLIGFGSDHTILDGGHGDGQQSVITVPPGISATIAGVAVIHGAAYDGGAILNKGVLTITNSLVRNNVGGEGGGISNRFGRLLVLDSTLMSNRALFSGGGIQNTFGTLTVQNSRVISNFVNQSGGGIENISGVLVVETSLVAGNNACNESCPPVTATTRLWRERPDVGYLSSGGGIENTGVMTISQSTFLNNDTFVSREGIANAGSAYLLNVTLSNASPTTTIGYIRTGGTMTLTNLTLFNSQLENHGSNGGTVWLKNTILANELGYPNCTEFGVTGPSQIISLGHNLDSGNSCGLNASGDLSGTNPLLGPLQDNGGPTPTHALLPGSPAINAGDIHGCPLTDQRGVRRPQGAFCDIGAFELAISGTTFTFLPVIRR